jgi:MraZ protein
VFQGSHAYHVDDKGRLKMPPDFSRGLGQTFTVTKGIGGCLWILPEDEWRAMSDRLRGASPFDHEALAVQRRFIGSAATVGLDGQGRLNIPPVLREAAQIQHEIMLVGIGSRIEIWARERWDQYDNQLSDELIEQSARRVGL